MSVNAVQLQPLPLSALAPQLPQDAELNEVDLPSGNHIRISILG